MHEIAVFMRTYQAYRHDQVLKMPAITFLALLNEAYRLKFGDAMLLAQVGDLPSMDKKERISFYQQLEWASTHPGDILKSDAGSGSSPAEIKKLLG